MNIITKANAQHNLNMRGRRVRAKVFPSSSWQLITDSLGERDPLSDSVPEGLDRLLEEDIFHVNGDRIPAVTPITTVVTIDEGDLSFSVQTMELDVLTPVHRSEID